jgi:uncharacterized repeat protein (TIGR03803 family)
MKRFSTILITFLLYSVIINAQSVSNMWGMTQGGGIDKVGVIFSTDATGDNFTERYQFSYTNIGARPEQTQLIEYNGKFYGMTSNGGIYNDGVIFEWDSTTNIYTKKIDFDSLNGKWPYGSLSLYGGKFYGMTLSGGNNNLGVIFEWDPLTNVHIKKFEFTNISNGYYPYGSLTLMGGKFYGMTWGGGVGPGGGVIFQWDPVTNIYTIKRNFDGINGAGPLGDLTFNSGKFYGMTNYGGISNRGVIFEWDPSTNIYTKKIDMFDFNKPQGNLTFLGGKFYGLAPTYLFEWDPVTNIFMAKISLGGASPIGTNALGSLTQYSGKLYGLTSSGGNISAGIILEYDPVTNICTKKYDFDILGGCNPHGSLTLSGNKFYGLTHSGGGENGGSGTLFEWNPASNIYTKKITFYESQGDYASGSLVYKDGKYYGMTVWGGSNRLGTIFEWDPITYTYNKKIDLSIAKGNNPNGNLTLNAGKFYGMTMHGGSNNLGTIFEWDPVSNAYTKKIDFSTTGGCSPTGGLSLSGGKFYAVTQTGGSNNTGVIFEWDPVSNTYTKKIDFSSANGSTPTGNLSLNGGKFYGMTSSGGNNNAGVIFEWNPLSNIYAKKIDLSSVTGSNPNGNLVYFNDKFYGLTQLGGNNNQGTIFEWDPVSNIYTKKIDLSLVNGAKPFGSLLMNKGKFYGMTNEGGINNQGVIFEWDPVSNVYTKKKDFTGTDGGKPYYGNDLVLGQAPDTNIPGSLQINLRPNIINSSSINVELIAEKSDETELLIIDVNGRKILVKQLTIQAGTNNISLNGAGLISGIYWLYCVGKEGKSNVVRFIKK